jgi:GT2 family glycosyltransferase
MLGPLIQCVVVLYQCSVSDSKTLQSLASCCDADKDLGAQISLLIYDNSPVPQQFNPSAVPCGQVEYQHSPVNGGLAAAYNEALARTLARGLDWLLLLDQDTALDPAFFRALVAAIRSAPAEVCAIVPKLTRDGTILSPQVVAFFRNCLLPRGFSGVHARKVTAMNSAACLRVQAIVAIGGFPTKYWLDYLDHVVFHWLQVAGGKVLILDALIEHRLSLNNMEKEMSLSRYANVLAAEWMFVRETRCGGGPFTHRVRLAKRALSYVLTMKNKSYAWQTLQAALRQD